MIIITFLWRTSESIMRQYSLVHSSFSIVKKFLPYAIHVYKNENLIRAKYEIFTN